jgi:MinD superfamily P-loop ATPase
MKQLLVLSGKGGTGKTTMATAFIHLSKAKVFADCDVDAPNLHLLMSPFEKVTTSTYYGMDKAYIDTEACGHCGLCMTHCRFDAIKNKDHYEVNPLACEGCGVCEKLCPTSCIQMKTYDAGSLNLFEGHAYFSTGTLKMGNGTSGLLVTEVKKPLQAVKEDYDFAIIDGSPGIGCPVVASMVGVDLILIVSEPSVSGLSDLKRLVETAEHFKTPVAVCVNKHDTQPVFTMNIKKYCNEKAIPFVGQVPFDAESAKGLNHGKNMIEMNGMAKEAIEVVYENVMQLLHNQ